MSELTAVSASLCANSAEALAQCDEAEAWLRTLPQVEIRTEQVLHAGMYARTVRVPAGVAVVGVLIRLATLLIVEGEAEMLMGERWTRVSGYGVFRGEAGRKQAMLARSDVAMTMIFPTSAATVEAAENEFTGEPEKLMSRRQRGGIVENEFAIGV